MHLTAPHKFQYSISSWMYYDPSSWFTIPAAREGVTICRRLMKQGRQNFEMCIYNLSIGFEVARRDTNIALPRRCLMEMGPCLGPSLRHLFRFMAFSLLLSVLRTCDNCQGPLLIFRANVWTGPCEKFVPYQSIYVANCVTRALTNIFSGIQQWWSAREFWT